MRSLELPVFQQLASAQRVLIAGAGGGFDLFSGLPLFFALQQEGKQVFLGSLSFSNLREAYGNRLGPHVLEVTPDAGGSESYFPERELSLWFQMQGQDVPIFAFDRAGVRQLTVAYQTLVEHLELDTVVLADGGTDSLMRGDECDLGTPEEDISSILAVEALKIPRKLLVCLGFGIDAFHGICHALFLENTSALIRSGSFLGAFSLTADMDAVRAYREATLAVIASTTSALESIVCTSILSALDGHFGDHHATQRTAGSELFINPLMSQYWCFDVDGVADRILYADVARATESMTQLAQVIDAFRARLPRVRGRREIPV